MQLERLSLENEAEILALLQDVWPRLYGATGCPQFSSDYLRWLYGGPDAERHLLLGCRIDGRLVGFKAYLSRDLRQGGMTRSGCLSTHLTIRPELEPNIRLNIAAELSQLHPLAPDAGSERRDLLLAFFESSKTLVRNITRMAGQQKLNLAMRQFRQGVLNVRRVASVAGQINDMIIGTVDTSADLPAICSLAGNRAADDLAWLPTKEVLLHHLTRAPGALALIARDGNGQSVGSLGGYRMDWLKNGSLTRMFIVESLMTANRDAIASLLAAAARHSSEQGYRGVVIENPTIFHDDEAETIGVAETAREMVLTVRSHQPLTEKINQFSTDVK